MVTDGRPWYERLADQPTGVSIAFGVLAAGMLAASFGERGAFRWLLTGEATSGLLVPLGLRFIRGKRGGVPDDRPRFLIALGFVMAAVGATGIAVCGVLVRSSVYI